MIDKLNALSLFSSHWIHSRSKLSYMGFAPFFLFHNALKGSCVGSSSSSEILLVAKWCMVLLGRRWGHPLQDCLDKQTIHLSIYLVKKTKLLVFLWSSSLLLTAAARGRAIGSNCFCANFSSSKTYIDSGKTCTCLLVLQPDFGNIFQLLIRNPISS